MNNRICGCGAEDDSEHKMSCDPQHRAASRARIRDASARRAATRMGRAIAMPGRPECPGFVVVTFAEVGG